ncbi:unnamed protein product [Arabis nemorensis]|uniref:Uncharacterized protein n=1 Tax=Arabis nemorensis TaxID=586526 RepID=A0A565CA82_9BRAS|nr:unnamed protein product [Arabis nemorensis]
MGRSISVRDGTKLKKVEEIVKAEYGLNNRIDAELSYWTDDRLTRYNGLEVAPTIICDNHGFMVFCSLRKGDKSLNLFVTFSERVNGEVRILGSVDDTIVASPRLGWGVLGTQAVDRI